MEIVVNDTNIFIDLCCLHLLAEVFELPLTMHTVDFVMAELQDSQRREVEFYHKNGKLIIYNFSDSELESIINLQASTPGNVSITDCSAWYYAKENKYILITGDGQLRKKAAASSVEVRGILFLFDLMVDTHILTPIKAADKLCELQSLNQRLPGKEISERIKKWRQKTST